MDVIGTVIIVVITKWYLIFPSLLLLAFVFAVRAFFINTARDLKRLEGIARSPIYSHTTLTLSGLPTIRAFQSEDLFVEQFYRNQNEHTAVYLSSWSVSRAMGNLIDSLCQLFILSVFLFFMIFYDGLFDWKLEQTLTLISNRGWKWHRRTCSFNGN